MRALLLAGLLALSGCELDEATLGGTIVSVVEAERAAEPEASPKSYDDPLAPKPELQVEVRLDNGGEVKVLHNGAKRYAPGERVRLLRGEDGELLL